MDVARSSCGQRERCSDNEDKRACVRADINGRARRIMDKDEMQQDYDTARCKQ